MTGHPLPGDPATQEWHTAMTKSTGARLREALDANQQLAAELQKAQAALAASQADLTQINARLATAEEDYRFLCLELAETKHQWALDVEALINARQENEQLTIRLDDADRTLAADLDALANARAELERKAGVIKALQGRLSWIVAGDGGRHCERCEGEIRRGEAYQVQDGTGGLIAHIHCPDRPEGSNRAD